MAADYANSVTIDFGDVPIYSIINKEYRVLNTLEVQQKYKAAVQYIDNNIDSVFTLKLDPDVADPNEEMVVKVSYRPDIEDHFFIEYFIIAGSHGYLQPLIVKGRCLGPRVILSTKRLMFIICKNVSETREKEVVLTNETAVETYYQWVLPLTGLGYFNITNRAGNISGHGSVSCNVTFSAIGAGVYTAELICLVHSQAPVILNVIALCTYPGNIPLRVEEHLYPIHCQNTYYHYLANDLRRLPKAPNVTIFDRSYDFGTGSTTDVTKNISQTLSVTNTTDIPCYFQWVSDPDGIFQIDPLGCPIQPRTSKLFTMRFRPAEENKSYFYLLFGYAQHKIDGNIHNTWNRVSCIGNTWQKLLLPKANWQCPIMLTMPPTIPCRPSIRNFILFNKGNIPLTYKFIAPTGSQYTVRPMCAMLQPFNFQIISVALETLTAGNFFEQWNLRINREENITVSLMGTAEVPRIEILSESEGFSPGAHAMLIFPPTITGKINCVDSLLHNLTRNTIHIRVWSRSRWIGADYGGSIILKPKEIVPFYWWFFPRKDNCVYQTTLVCSCLTLLHGEKAGNIQDIFVHFTGYSENPDLKVLPKSLNLHDIIVGETLPFELTLYNFGSCPIVFTVTNFIEGMGDDCSEDSFSVEPQENCLNPSQHCKVTCKICPRGAGSRQINIRYTVIYHTQQEHFIEKRPEINNVCTIWYDGIYPTFKVKRTHCKSSIAFTGHDVWHNSNVNEWNKALEDCRPNKPLTVNIYAPDFYHHAPSVTYIFVLGCVYNAPVTWAMEREKICDCAMVEVAKGLSTFYMAHNCVHRDLVKICPFEGTVHPEEPQCLHITFDYSLIGQNTLAFVINMSHDRVIHLRVSVNAIEGHNGCLVPLRRHPNEPYYAVMDCGRVPINNLGPVLRILWLYNPSTTFATCRFLRHATKNENNAIKCLVNFADIASLERFALLFEFFPTEMVDYECTMSITVGYQIFDILVKGQGGLPSSIETRPDMPSYIERIIRGTLRENMVYLSHDHLIVPVMPTHSLTRHLICLANDTENRMRFIWMPDRIPNVVNINVTPSWGVLEPKSCQWLNLSVYTLQEPGTFTSCITVEIVDLTIKEKYTANEKLKKWKKEKCYDEFTIHEDGLVHDHINKEPPYVEDMEAPMPFFLPISVSVSSTDQGTGLMRMPLKRIQRQTPPFDLHCYDYRVGILQAYQPTRFMPLTEETLAIIDTILWEVLHSKTLRWRLQFYAKEPIPELSALTDKLENAPLNKLSKRIASSICEAIVAKAIYDVYSLEPCNDLDLFEM